MESLTRKLISEYERNDVYYIALNAAFDTILHRAIVRGGPEIAAKKHYLRSIYDNDCHHQIPTSYSFMLCDKLGQIIYTKTESDEQNVMEIFFKTLDYVEQIFFPLLQRHREKTDYKPNLSK